MPRLEPHARVADLGPVHTLGLSRPDQRRLAEFLAARAQWPTDPSERRRIGRFLRKPTCDAVLDAARIQLCASLQKTGRLRAWVLRPLRLKEPAGREAMVLCFAYENTCVPMAVRLVPSATSRWQTAADLLDAAVRQVLERAPVVVDAREDRRAVLARRLAGSDLLHTVTMHEDAEVYWPQGSMLNGRRDDLELGADVVFGPCIGEQDFEYHNVWRIVRPAVHRLAGWYAQAHVQVESETPAQFLLAEAERSGSEVPWPSRFWLSEAANEHAYGREPPCTNHVAKVRERWSALARHRNNAALKQNLADLRSRECPWQDDLAVQGHLTLTLAVLLLTL